MQKLLGVVCVFTLYVVALFSQGFSSLSGVVTDPTGAVVPSANITITNTQTGAQRETTADGQGRYTFSQVVPGTYRLLAKAPGFADANINAIELLVNSPATVNVLFEKVGSVQEAVSVEATAVQVNTTDATLGNAIGAQAISQLPFFARNVAGLLQYQPGVTSFGTATNGITVAFGPNANDPNNGGTDDRNGSVNGGKSDQANVTLDGVDVNDQANRAAFTTVLRVTLDSVQEFRTTTANGNADSGRGSGADIALITKTGTNQFHGSLYEYHRNTITAANSFFNNAAGVPRAPLLVNVFGGSVGGPIKKNRTFFFLNYEGRRDATAIGNNQIVPSDTLRQGIVQYFDTSGNVRQVGPDVIKNVVDPLHIGIDPAVLKLFNTVYPRGNDPTQGDTLNFIGYRFTAPGRTDQNTYIARFDHQLDSAGKHQLFIRGNLQNDSDGSSSTNAPQFPGQPPASLTLNNNKGLAADWTAVLTPTLVSTFRYGFTRFGGDQTGVLSNSYSFFRGLSTPYAISTGFTQIIPVHNIVQDFAWTHGAHDIRFGGSVRLIKNGTRNFANSFSNAQSNLSWLKGSGADITPASLNVDPNSINVYGDPMIALLGLLSQGTANYNYDIKGNALPSGSPIIRNFNNEEYEMYVQDSWKVKRNFTVTAGIRLGLDPPVHEANHVQISADRPFQQWLLQRQTLAFEGLPQSQAGDISYVLADSPQGRPLYPYHKNWAPRIGLAYSPSGDSGISRFLFGGSGKTSIRAGFGVYYDLIGQPLAATQDASAFGLSSSLTNPANTTTAVTAARFTDFFSVPLALIPPAPRGGFPVKQPSSGLGSFAITNSIDDQLKAPYSMNLNFSIGREFSHGFFIQGSYVGRLSRRSLVNRDIAMPVNLRDPVSGQTYFQAMSAIGTALYFQHIPYNQVPAQPFFEHFWSTAAAGGLTATQVVAGDLHFNSNKGDFTNTLFDIDEVCSPNTTINSDGSIGGVACSIYGPNAIFNPQFSALSAWSSVGGGDYHAMQWTFRKRFSDGLLFDFNYTLSKSTDLGSTAENGGSFAGFIVNTWNTSQRRGVSNYDTLHAVNGYAVWAVPVGRNRKFGAGMNRVLDAFIGGWQIAGTYRQTSGLPANVSDGRRWATNWQVSTFATPSGIPRPPVVNIGNGSNAGGGPNLFADPVAALAAYQLTLAGQTGTRNTLRGAGFFDLDSGVSKSFTMPYSENHHLQFRWETFNLTNSVRFDPASASLSLTARSSFGNLTGQLGAPRQMQFALRYDF